MQWKYFYHLKHCSQYYDYSIETISHRKWEDVDSFVAVAIYQNPPGSAKRYDTQSPVFHWQGSHFDEIDTLPTYNPQALTQFNIGSSKFIVVANFQNDLGEIIYVYLRKNRWSLFRMFPNYCCKRQDIVTWVKMNVNHHYDVGNLISFSLLSSLRIWVLL